MANSPSKRSEGFADVPEGKLHWVYDEASPPLDSPRPTLAFVHAGVADLTQWDEQVAYFTQKGWNCLRHDLLGFGQSHATAEYLAADPRGSVRRFDQMASLLDQFFQTPAGKNANRQVVPVGLSMGGATVLYFALEHAKHLAGVVCCAGGINGLDCKSDPVEDAEFGKEEALMQARDIEGLAAFNTHVWGDGPKQREGRAPPRVRELLLKWCREIAVRECDKTGGFSSEAVDPPAGTRLKDISAPVAIAIGIYDEMWTNDCMRQTAEKVSDGTLKEFEAAHMINLEQPDQFNAWLLDWLEKKVLK